MKTKKPLVSIIMTVYNGMPYLKDSVNSLLKQTYTNTEIIIIDDGSNDESALTIKSFKKRFENIKLYKSVRIGRSKALNLGLKKSKGKYIAINDSDDLSMPDRIKKQVNFLEKNKDYVMVGSMIKLYDLVSKKIFNDNFDNRPVNNLEIKRFFFEGQPIQHSSVMYRRNAALKIGMYNNINFLIDRDFFIRISDVGKLYNLNLPLVHIGRGDNQYFRTKYKGKNRRFQDLKYRIISSFKFNSNIRTKIKLMMLLFWVYIPNNIKKFIK